MKSSTTISIDKGVLEQARAEAKDQRRSLSAQIEAWLVDILGSKDAKASPQLTSNKKSK